MASRNKGFLSPEFLIPVLGFVFSFTLIELLFANIVRPRAADIAITSRLLAAQNDPNARAGERDLSIIIKDPEQESEIIAWIWGLIIIGYKLRQVRLERKFLTHDFVHLEQGERILPDDALDRYKDLRATIEGTPQWRDRLLPEFVLAALHRFHATNSVQEASAAVKERAELAADTLDSNLSLIRYIAWYIPAAGFVGTVRGIGQALAEVDKAVKGDLSGVTASLGLAFNSTLVALLLSMVLMFLIHLLQRRQEGIIIEFQTHCRDKLIDLMKTPSQAGDEAVRS